MRPLVAVAAPFTTGLLADLADVLRHRRMADEIVVLVEVLPDGSGRVLLAVDDQPAAPVASSSTSRAPATLADQVAAEIEAAVAPPAVPAKKPAKKKPAKRQPAQGGTCPECQGGPFTPVGLGVHRARKHGVKGATRTPAATPDVGSVARPAADAPAAPAGGLGYGWPPPVFADHTGPVLACQSCDWWAGIATDLNRHTLRAHGRGLRPSERQPVTGIDLADMKASR